MYPSVEELIPDLLMNKLPKNLAEEIIHRYQTLGPNYLTDVRHLDGRPVNGMIYTDRIVNCLEEVVDAVFCILGQIFKDTNSGHMPSENLADILDGLIHVWTLLSLEYAKGGYS